MRAVLGDDFVVDLGQEFLEVTHNCYQPDATTDAAWYHHDHRRAEVRGTIINDGPASGATFNGRTYYANGMLLNDVTGTIDLTCRGVAYGYRTRGSSICEIRRYQTTGLAGNGEASAYPMYFENAGSAGSHGRFRSVTMSDASTTIQMSAGFTATPDWELRFQEVIITAYGYKYTNVVLARLPVGSALVGKLVHFILGTAGETHVEITTGPVAGCAVIAIDNTSSTLIMVAVDGFGVVNCTATAVAVGDLLVASATAGLAEADNSPADPLHVFGVALSSKAGGATGVVRYRPA